MENSNMDSVNIDFKDKFNREIISSEKIQFAKHYLENILEFDLENDPLIVFSPIKSSVFGYLVAHIVVEYEKFKENN